MFGDGVGPQRLPRGEAAGTCAVPVESRGPCWPLAPRFGGDARSIGIVKGPTHPAPADPPEEFRSVVGWIVLLLSIPSDVV